MICWHSSNEDGSLFHAYLKTFPKAVGLLAVMRRFIVTELRLLPFPLQKCHKKSSTVLKSLAFQFDVWRWLSGPLSRSSRMMLARAK
ncbi:hypothetical protein HOLleu_13251 [Holothuria leucospilota]|uniref:Uncharacterized protein n=1 Tax=Holothuria leucospilota TaxID=206669 RepID=A0A9Q1CBK0_HOLLE|nr:hypothetical protein HOLleu_13251 [Holothuria leucospilota]